MHRAPVLLLVVISAYIFTSCLSGDTTPTFTPGGTPPHPITITATTAPSLVITKEVQTFTPIPTSTSTLEPMPSPTRTATQIPTLTYTLSPLSFDASKVVTRTPANPASCPQSNPDVKPTFIGLLSDVFPDLEKPILDYLNSGGTWETMLAVLDWSSYRRTNYLFEGDLTGDNVPKLVISYGPLFVFGCKDGKYSTLLTIPVANVVTPNTPSIVGVADMNLDGIKELIVETSVLAGWTGSTYLAQIFEWDGIQFESMVNSPMQDQMCMGWAWPDSHTVCMANADIFIKDFDGNGTKELVLSGGVLYAGLYYNMGPWRTETQIYSWNGDTFVYFTSYFSAPEYRYQAVQDGDRAALQGNYQEALDLYQQAIFSDKLDWWSLARKKYYMDVNVNGNKNVTPPAPDPNEYYCLAAYARYRIMLLDVLRNYRSDAQTVYDTLQGKFPEGQAGYSYAEMAAAFWNEYQSSTNISLACSKAINYATNHSNEILYYLGSDYHGVQDIVYKPEDICPFK